MSGEKERLQLRRDAVVERVRISDLLSVMGFEGTENRKKIPCIFPDHEERTASMQVYPETDSVYCFGCTKSGDVVEIVRRCAGKGKGLWTTDKAITWLERKFNVTPPPLREVLSSKLKRERDQKKRVGNGVDSDLVLSAVTNSVLNDLDRVHSGVSGEVRAAYGDFEDFLWETLYTTDDGYGWVEWARVLVNGYLAKSVGEMNSWFTSDEFKTIKEWVELEERLFEEDATGFSYNG